MPAAPAQWHFYAPRMTQGGTSGRIYHSHRFPAAHRLQRRSGRIRTTGKSKRDYRSAENTGYASDALRHVSTFGGCCGAGKSKGSGGGGEGAITSSSSKGTRFALIGYLTPRTHINISSSGIPTVQDKNQNSGNN